MYHVSGNSWVIRRNTIFWDSSTFPQGQSIHHYLLISQKKSLEPNAAKKDKKNLFSACVAVGELQSSSFEGNHF